MDIWDKYAEAYDKITPLNKFYQNLLDKTLDISSSYDTILDAGCGTGILFQKLLDKGKTVYGVDLNENMLSIANSKINGRKGLLIRQNIENINFKDQSFGAVISLNVLYCINDANKFLQEAYKTLKNNGLFILTSLKPNPDLSVLFNNAIENFKLAGIYGEVKTDLETVIECNKALGKSAFKNLYDVDEIKKILSDIGLATIYSDSHTYLNQSFFIVAKKEK